MFFKNVNMFTKLHEPINQGICLFTATCAHFRCLASFVIVIELIQQFFLVVKRPFVTFCWSTSPLFAKSVFCLSWPSFSRWKRARSLFLPQRHPCTDYGALNRVSNHSQTQHVIDVMWQLASIINSFDRTCQLSIK